MLRVCSEGVPTVEGSVCSDGLPAGARLVAGLIVEGSIGGGEALEAARDNMARGKVCFQSHPRAFGSPMISFQVPSA
jgi:hypothetical protein